MAYAAVASLLQTWEYLLQVSCLILQVKMVQARNFCDEFYPFLWHLKPFLNISTARLKKLEEFSMFDINRFMISDDLVKCLVQSSRGRYEEKIEPLLRNLPEKIEEKEIRPLLLNLHEKTKPAFLPIAEYVKTVNNDNELISGILEITKRLFGICHGTTIRSEKTLGISERLSRISEELQFIAETSDEFLSSYSLLKGPENVAFKISRNIQRIWFRISFDHNVVLQTMFVCKNLQFFLCLLENSSGKFYDPRIVRSLKNVADEAGNFVEDCMMDNPMEIQMKYFLVNCLKTFADKGGNFVEDRMMYGSMRSPKRYFLDLLTAEDRFFLYPDMNRLDLEKVVEDIFDGENGIRQNIFQALEEIHQLKEEISEVHDKTSSLQAASNSSLEGLSLRNSKRDIVVGLDDEMIRIMEGLTRLPSGLEIVSIVGMGGIGKTTLARQIFHHRFIGYHFHCRAWVTVSQDYSVRNLLLGLLGSAARTTDEMFEKSNAQLAEKLYRSLQGKRYLIVMDDMWSTSAWNDIKRCFPDEKIGSRIIVTSRFTELAIHTNPRNRPHCMNLLDFGQSSELLEKLVFGQEVCPPQLADVGKEIVRKCKGLPLAIVVVAGLLSQIRTHEWWKKIADCVSSTVCNDLEQCLDILALSYEYLPHHLKACFLYMGVFPEDCEIGVRKIIQIWIAEGLIRPRSSKNLEEIAEGFLEDLIDRSLIMVGKRSFRGKVKTCKLHDLLRELCLREARKENFLSVLKGEEQCFPPDASNQCRLSFQLNSDGDVHLAPPYPHLRSFLCFTLGSDFVPDIFFSSLNFKLLRVLDMFFLHFDSFPPQIVKLANLRYLALKVTFELPKSISKLWKLQTLIIHGPWNCKKDEKIQTLSLEYWNMLGLRHLYITVASCLANPSFMWDFLQNRLQAPRYLQTLSTISFDSCKGEVFSIMPHLKKLSICETKTDYYTDSSSQCLKNLVHLRELETLKCSFYHERKREQRNFCWNAIPSGLKKLTLSQSFLPWKNMALLAELPNLEVLKLKGYAFQGPEWEPTEAGFRCLKHLLIEKTDLVFWEATSNDFPCLQHLILKSCELLHEIPCGVGEISALQRLELHYCSESAEMSAKQIEREDLDIVIRSNWLPDSAVEPF